MRVLGAVVIFSGLLLGCSKPPVEELFARAQEAQRRAEAGLGSAPSVQDSLFTAAIGAYEVVIEEYPGDRLAEVSLFTIAELHNSGTRRFSDAIATYRRYIAAYPGTPKAAVCMFMIGFLFNNEVRNLDSASVAYRTFIEAFPTHELAASARAELANLGKSPEQIIERQLAESKEQEPGAGVPGKKNGK